MIAGQCKCPRTGTVGSSVHISRSPNLAQFAAQKMALEYPGETPQATALVHEAYLTLVRTREFAAAFLPSSRGSYASNSHRARRQLRQRHGGDRRRVGLLKIADIGANNSCRILPAK